MTSLPIFNKFINSEYCKDMTRFIANAALNKDVLDDKTWNKVSNFVLLRMQAVGGTRPEVLRKMLLREFFHRTKGNKDPLKSGATVIINVKMEHSSFYNVNFRHPMWLLISTRRPKVDQPFFTLATWM